MTLPPNQIVEIRKPSIELKFTLISVTICSLIFFICQDAWNGFHSIPIRKEDRYLTTFQTPLGSLRYARAPQGALGSGDGYNQRWDIILMNFRDKERCVDDTVVWDDVSDVEGHWWRNIEFLELSGNNGSVLNPKKFQCALPTIDFAGFRVTPTTIQPLPKYIECIRNFPKPCNITDIRAWFGLTNQVSHYAQLRALVAPMKPLLKKNAKFEWTAELDSAFETSKEKIITAIKEGVEIFDMGRPTCLSTDWSKVGIGYFLNQKHCECASPIPGCCDEGWRITLAGSRDLKPAETRYAPVEGESLAIFWSLDQTKYFTLGCKNLIVATDHKPLSKLYGDRNLDEIHNLRLFHFKEKSLPWRFVVVHRPGKENFTADALSRYPSNDATPVTELMETEMAMIGAIKDDFKKIKAVTWERIKSEMQKDENMKMLLNVVTEGFPNRKEEMPSGLVEYWKYRDTIFVVDEVLLCR